MSARYPRRPDGDEVGFGVRDFTATVVTEEGRAPALGEISVGAVGASGSVHFGFLSSTTSNKCSNQFIPKAWIVPAMNFPVGSVFPRKTRDKVAGSTPISFASARSLLTKPNLFNFSNPSCFTSRKGITAGPPLLNDCCCDAVQCVMKPTVVHCIASSNPRPAGMLRCCNDFQGPSNVLCVVP